MGDKCKLVRPKETRVGVGDKWETSVNSCAPQSVGDKWKTSVNSCDPRNPSVRDKCETSVKIMRPEEPRVGKGDKCGETSVNSCGPRTPEWEWETSVGDKCKLMRPKAPRVGGTSGRQVQNHAAQGTQNERQVWETRGRQEGDKRETSENSCDPRNPKWEISVGDKCWRQV